MNTTTAQINNAFSAYCHRAGYRPVSDISVGPLAIGEARLVSSRGKLVVETITDAVMTPMGYAYQCAYPLGAGTHPAKLVAHMNGSNR